MLTDPCLGPSGVCLLDASGTLTQTARDAFTLQVIALLTSGNVEGKGAKISTLLGIPFPPRSGIALFDPDKLLSTPNDPTSDLTWFDPAPLAALTFETLRDPSGAYQSFFVESLYGSLMRLMNVNGNPSAVPVLDYSGFLPSDLAAKLTLPDLPKIAIALGTPNPIVSLKALGIDLGDIASFVLDVGNVVPAPPVPSVPKVPEPSFDFVVVPDLFSGLFEVAMSALPSLVAQLASEPLALLTPTPPSLFDLASKVILGPVLELLAKLGLLTILPKLLMATFVVTIQNAVSAAACAAISQILGTGLVVKTVGQALALSV